MGQANENVVEWMGRIRVVALECNYKETDRQLKEQFMHRLNDSDMLAEIIKELTQTDENTHVTSEQVLAWAKMIKAQRAQSVVINSLSEVKEFDKIQTVRDDQKQNGINPHALVKCIYCGLSHQPR